jgi:hypothetical protein
MMLFLQAVLLTREPGPINTQGFMEETYARARQYFCPPLRSVAFAPALAVLVQDGDKVDHGGNSTSTKIPGGVGGKR